VIGGRFRSRRLPADPPPGTRPTGDRLRETVFNILGARVIESMFLDVYAGVGAVGIEALSRGASGVFFVDSSPTACRAIRRNLESLGIAESDRIQVRQGELTRVIGKPGERGVEFHIVFLDPPYARADLYERDLEFLGNVGALNEGCVVVAEHDRAVDLPERAGCFRRSRVHPQGDCALTFYRWESEWETEESS
jgi:16S rRNA (guanine(966)-N(2))-methyltransferase RsmD